MSFSDYNPIASREQIKERLEICKTCEFLKKGFVHTCSACGCAIRTKVALKSSECPKSFWLKIE